MKVTAFAAALAVALGVAYVHAHDLDEDDDDGDGRHVLLVTRAEDDGGPHTLRWAINESNAINRGFPGAKGNKILIVPPGKDAFVIKPQGDFLPPLVGPVEVRGLGGGKRPAVVLDGSNLVTPRTPSACPGATHRYDFAAGKWVTSRVSGMGPNVRGYYGAGLAVHDSHDVTIRRLEIRNFCLGVGAVRSNGVEVRRMWIQDHHGAAGVIFTGDDGNAALTTLSFNNRIVDSVLLDNGDGFEFTRGTHDSLAQGNYVALTQPLPEDGNAVEFAQPGSNNSLIGNVFTRYRITSVAINGGGSNHLVRDNEISLNGATALAVNGPGSVIRDNNIFDNGGIGLTLTGSGQRVEDNSIRNNGGAGISITNAATQNVTLTRNSIAGNAGLGIDLGPAGVNPNDTTAGCVDCDSGPNGLQNYPVLAASSSWTRAGITLGGTLASLPNQAYTVELFASRQPHASGFGEGEFYLGSTMVSTDAAGNASFSFTAREPHLFKDHRTTAYFTATATDAAGATSEFSQALMLSRY